jgi:hypothetical protein
MPHVFLGRIVVTVFYRVALVKNVMMEIMMTGTFAQLLVRLNRLGLVEVDLLVVGQAAVVEVVRNWVIRKSLFRVWAIQAERLTLF